MLLTFNCSLSILSFSLLETSAVFLRAYVFNSDLSEWNVAKVTNMLLSTCQFPLFNSPLPTTFLFFFSDKINFYKQFFVSLTPTIMLNLVLPPPCFSFTSCLILQCFILRINSTGPGATHPGLKKLAPVTSQVATVLLSAVPLENMSTATIITPPLPKK